VRVVVDTALTDPLETGVATAGDGAHVNSGPLDGLRQGRGDRAIDLLADEQERAGRGPRSTTACATG
jgi:leucyl-tRNA synthetase